VSRYQQTLDYLYTQLPQYQIIGGKAYKADLSNITEICNLLGNPQDKIRTIHVAGTNGKGSTSHLLASVLQEAGYKVGLYTSPHLRDFRERIKINGKMISKKKVVRFVEKNKDLLQEVNPSFFEWTVGLAFHYFAKQKTDICIIETGLGGRLDSTNIISPDVSVITNISLEHVNLLGDTIEEIALEKAGIIKESTPVVFGETQSETSGLFTKIAKEKGSKFYFADKSIAKNYKTDLKGKYQTKNVKTAVQTIIALSEIGWEITEKELKKGLKKVVKNTNILGRWQVLSKNPKIIVDVAHNSNGIKQVLEELQLEVFENLHFVIGIAQDKDSTSVLEILPKNATYYFCNSDNPRLMKSKELQSQAAKFNLKGKAFKTVEEALDSAKNNVDESDLIMVTGSNFIVAEVV